MNQDVSFPYDISFPDFKPSEAVSVDVEKYLKKLERLYDRIVSCHVAVRAPHKHHKNHIYHVHIRLKIPGEDIVVNREPEKNYSHADMHVAIRDAFNALHKQLRERVKQMRSHHHGEDE
ncbi:MAG: hypothetical protein A2Z20_02945 [Bdellovibrionales bacterium RBG_16_40_8]|nr:MAG: hypothetical protein A2Z20_02945 [Bdellovibrionales bacterium RBG_16_40_8]